MAGKQVYIDIVVDDKGTTKRVAVDAKKLGVALEGAGASAGKASKSQDGFSAATNRANKQTRALAGTANSLGKTMGNLSSGIQGGLVPAYATLAANVFAITALFDALSRAADTTKLIAGQEALAANTGVAYRTITNSIKDATGAQISYKDAASAAAIGGAAGLSATQLTLLGKAAKDTSLVLGRDLTDSFNRLIRGVTKAEPELLDELGIILRLEPATQKYADSIGKNVKELSAYERSQAVANEVLSQAESKFGEAAAGADAAGESIQRLKSSFDKLAEDIQTGLVNKLAPIFDFLAKNTASLVATLGLLGFGIIKQLSSMLGLVGPRMDVFATAAAKADQEIRALGTGAGVLGRRLKEDVPLGTAELEKLKKSANATNSSILNVTDANRKSALKNIEVLEVRQSQSLANAEGGWKKYTSATKNSLKIMQIESGKLIGLFRFIGRGGALLLRSIPFIGIGLMLIDLVKMTGIFSKKYTEAMKKAEQATKEFSESTKELNKDLERTARNYTINAKGARAATIATAGMLQSGDFIKRLEDFESLEKGTEGYEKAQERLAASFTHLHAVSKNVIFKEFHDSIKKGEQLTKKQKGTLSTLTSGYVEGAQALKTWGDTYTSIQKQLTSVAGTIDTPLSSLVTGLGAALVQAETGLGAVESTQSDLHTKHEEAQANVLSNYQKEKQQEKDLLALRQKRDEHQKSKGGRFSDQGAWAKENMRLAHRIRNGEQALINIRETGEALADVAETRRKDFELSTKEHGAELAKVKVLRLQKEEFDRGHAAIVSSQKERSANDLKYAQQQKLGITIAQKQQNIRNQELKLTNNRLKAEEAVEAAKTRQAAAQVKGVVLSKEQEDALSDAVTIAENGLETVKKENELKRQQNTLQIEALDFQKTLNDLKKQELASTKAVNAARLELKEIEAGIVPNLYGDAAKTAIAEARKTVARGALSAAQVQQQRAEEVYTEVQGRTGDKKASLQQLYAAQEQLITARARTAEAKLQLRILQLTGTELKNNMLTETQSLQFALNMQSLHPAQEQYNKNILAYKDAGIRLDKETLAFIEEESIKQQELVTMLELKKGVQESIANNFTRAFQSVAEGSMKAKHAFGQMAQSILTDIARMITRLYVMNTLMPLFSGGLNTQSPTSKGGTFNWDAGKNSSGGRIGFSAQDLYPDIFGRYGGMFEPYARGGIARGRDAGYPAILHGTEAVVPLPNGKSIPVEMAGGAGGTNNVSVNISMDNQGGSQEQRTADSGQMKQLGLVISGAVQEELQRQKRPGGILSPYGAA